KIWCLHRKTPPSLMRLALLQSLAVFQASVGGEFQSLEFPSGFALHRSVLAASHIPFAVACMTALASRSVKSIYRSSFLSSRPASSEISMLTGSAEC
ncbi:hypothetical protein K438DRAFT_1814365, partial [Mycena galopus ATCC 62051]